MSKTKKVLLFFLASLSFLIVIAVQIFAHLSDCLVLILKGSEKVCKRAAGAES